jgi:hypothetical protein
MTSYLEGWLEGRPDDELTVLEVYDILSIDLNNEDSYTPKGKLEED